MNNFKCRMKHILAKFASLLNPYASLIQAFVALVTLMFMIRQTTIMKKQEKIMDNQTVLMDRQEFFSRAAFEPRFQVNFYDSNMFKYQSDMYFYNYPFSYEKRQSIIDIDNESDIYFYFYPYNFENNQSIIDNEGRISFSVINTGYEALFVNVEIGFLLEIENNSTSIPTNICLPYINGSISSLSSARNMYFDEGNLTYGFPILYPIEYNVVDISRDINDNWYSTIDINYKVPNFVYFCETLIDCSGLSELVRVLDRGDENFRRFSMGRYDYELRFHFIDGPDIDFKLRPILSIYYINVLGEHNNLYFELKDHEIYSKSLYQFIYIDNPDISFSPLYSEGHIVYTLESGEFEIINSADAENTEFMLRQSVGFIQNAIQNYPN